MDTETTQYYCDECATERNLPTISDRKIGAIDRTCIICGINDTHMNAVSSDVVKSNPSRFKPKMSNDESFIIELKNKALRYNSGKLKWSLVHFKSLEPIVRVLEKGAIKYSPDNWKSGLDKKEILESMMRHLTALMDGEDLDQETGESHMGHIQCNALFYNYFNNKKDE